MSKDALRICRDCTHYAPLDGPSEEINLAFARCGRTPATLNPATGLTRKRLCETERTSRWPDCCGPSGHFYQPAEKGDTQDDVIP